MAIFKAKSTTVRRGQRPWRAGTLVIAIFVFCVRWSMPVSPFQLHTLGIFVSSVGGLCSKGS